MSARIPFSSLLVIPPAALSVAACTFLVTPLGLCAQSGSILTLLSTEGRSLSVGQEVTGALSSSDPRAPDDALLEVWSLEGRAGQRVTIDLYSSDFDAYLYLVGPGFDETLRDDDGAGGCDARLATTFLENGTFSVVASSQDGGAACTFSSGSGGRFDIRVTPN